MEDNKNKQLNHFQIISELEPISEFCAAKIYQ